MENTVQAAALSVDEACIYIGIGRAHLYRLMDEGSVPSLHVGRRRLLLRKDLDAFLDRQKAVAGA